MKFQLKDVLPNPHRRIEHYRILPEKVAALKESIESTEFWENIVGREVAGKLQIAYGHHRLAALKELYPGTQEFDWRVKELSDGVMLQIMVRENNEVYGTDVPVLLESVRAAVAALAAGQISAEEMPAPDLSKGGPKGTLRYAPSFVSGVISAPDTTYPYTATNLGVFLGMARSSGQASRKLEIALNALALEEEGYLKKPERFTWLVDLEAAVTDADERRRIDECQKAREEADRKAAEERRKTAEEAKKAETKRKEAEAARKAEAEARRKEEAAQAEAEEAKRKAARADEAQKKAAQKKAAEAEERSEKAKRDAQAKEERREEAEQAHEKAEKAAKKQRDAEESKRNKAAAEAEKQEVAERAKKDKKAKLISLIKTAHEMVAAGRRALAEKRHPDKGGSQEQMVEVNDAKVLLDSLIDEYEKEELSLSRLR